MAEGIPLALFGFVIVLSFLLSLLALFRVRFLLRLEEEEDVTNVYTTADTPEE